MSYLDHDGLAYFKSKLDRTFIADIEFDDGDIKLYGGDGTLLKTVVQEGTVTQKKSTANKEYPVLLCWDADAEEDQTMKTVWYGLDARVNPKFGYFYARRYYTEHPSYERTNAPTARAEWHHVFTDAVSAPMGEVYEYLDRTSDGGEHRMELRLYGNPLSQYVDTPNHNEATDAVSLGLGATRGEKLTFFGYAPSTPIYLEDGSTMRKSLARGDQYGKDIITRDWLNLNGSITGLVHTYMDETIDGYKTFLKTVTIDSGDDNNKAGLNVQGDVNIDSGDNTKPSNLYVQGNSHTHGNETVDGKLTVGGTAEISGGSGDTPSLKVNGNEVVTGKLTAEDLEATDDLTVGDDATIGGDLNVPNGTTTTKILHVTDDATVDDDLNVGGDANVAGTINKVSGGSTTEYVQYITNQPSNREAIAANLIDGSKGLYITPNGKIGVELQNNGGLKFDGNGGIYVDFASATDDVKGAVLSSLGMQIPRTSDLTLYVNKNSSAATDSWRNSAGVIDKTVGTSAKPFATIQGAVSCATQGYSWGTHHCEIVVTKGNTAYEGSISLPEFNHTTGYIKIKSASSSSLTVVTNGSNAGGVFTCSGSDWYLEELDIRNTTSAINDGVAHFPTCVSASGNGYVHLRGCKLTFTYSGAAPSSGSIYPRMVSATTNGTIAFELMENVVPSITASMGNNSSLVVLFAERQGYISFNATNSGSSSSSWHKIACSGSCSTFARSAKQSLITTIGGATYDLEFSGSMSGKRCDIDTASAVSFSAVCPGDTNGSVDSNTYCWVKPNVTEMHG